MDSWEAVIAVVFGSMTGSKQAPTLFEALPPWSPILMPSRRKIAQSATFAKPESASAVAETSRTSLTRARGFSSSEMIRNAEPKGRAEVQALLNALKTTASGRRQVEKESRFSAAARVRTVAASYWRYHDFPHTGRELTTATSGQGTDLRVGTAGLLPASARTMASIALSSLGW